LTQPGRKQSGMAYNPEDWREHGIRARRFAPCPHCGASVSARERVWLPRGGTKSAIFREARCSNADCGWRYFGHDGSRDAFVAAVNRRTHHEDR